MNRERLNELAETIDGLPTVPVDWKSVFGKKVRGFSMKETEFLCGSPACLLGWTRSLWEGPPEVVLALTLAEAEDLFMPWNQYADFLADPGDSKFVTSSHAAAVLRHAANTGKIDWSVGRDLA